MRLSYGTVRDYDAARRRALRVLQTTAQGILEKEDPKNDEFVVPTKEHGPC